MQKSLVLAVGAAILCGGSGAVGGGARRVAGHVPSAAMAGAWHMGRHGGESRVSLAVSLRLRDQAGLNELIGGLYDPADPRFRQFLTPAEFRDRYAPTDDDVAAVAKYFTDRGLRVTGASEGNLLLNVEGSAAQVEDAFQVELHDYVARDGRHVFAPHGEPLVLGDAAERVAAVNGLSTFAKRGTHKRLIAQLDASAVAGAHAAIGDYITPAKLRKAYGLDTLPKNGAGETIALFELDGYNVSDITSYASYFGLTTPTLQNVYVSDGTSAPTGAAGADTSEVALDIEVAMATAPGLSKIIVYEGKNDDQGVLNTYARIANDNAAKEVSTSWGSYELGATASLRNSENTIFQQMAAQGQSIFAAAGDGGAYDDGSTLSVDDPASQPYVTAVGGTTLTADATTGAYMAESSWGVSANKQGGGGGISSVWAQPSYQAGLATVANKGCASAASCTNKRMVPDVSLDANPSSGYPIYVTLPGKSAAWYAIGGTSAAAPIWAAFMAIVNQGRVANGSSRIGFANTALYQIAQSTLYASTFHDVADSSTNLYYPAVTGYDLSTGLGTIKGPGLYNALVSGTLPPAAPASLALISSSTSVTASWTASSTAVSYNVYRSATGTAGTFGAIATGVTTLSYADTTAVGLNYYYVTAVNSAGESAPSSVQSASINQSPPSAPTGLTGMVIK